MSAFVTRNGLQSECTATDCFCNAPTANVTPGAIAAAAEREWLNALTEAVEEKLNLYRAWVAAPKSERDAAYAALEQCENDIITRFLPADGRWGK